FSTRSVTPGAPREFSACRMQVASRASRMACVPMTVIGLPLLSGAGRKPVASPVSWIASLPILRAPKSVFRHVVVDLVRPGQNAALDALGIFEALLLHA